MITTIQFIRKAIIDRLTNAVSYNGNYVPVYNRVRSNASFPYIWVYSVSEDESDFNQSSFITQTITRIEVVTRYSGDAGGELAANQITSQILNLIRTRSNGYFDLSAQGFDVFTCVCEGMDYYVDEDDDYTYYRCIMEISNKIQQND